MINLSKDNRSVSLSKVPSIQVVVTWPAVTDYDLGAEILYKDGTTESLATFGAYQTQPQSTSRNGTVRLSGDAGRGSGVASETLYVEWDDEIDTIAPWVYSAQSNGTGSFYRHRVGTTITAGSQAVTIDADNASNNDTIYTLVPGFLKFDGSIQVEYAEFYSRPNTELRPKFKKTMMGRRSFDMAGPRNNYK